AVTDSSPGTSRPALGKLGSWREARICGRWGSWIRGRGWGGWQCSRPIAICVSHGRVDLAAVLELVLAFNDYELAATYAAAQPNAIAGGLRDSDRTDCDRVVAGYGIDVGSLRPTLDRRSGNNREIVHGVHEQVHVYELIGKKSVVGIVEDGLQLVSAGGRIDFVIDSEQLASGNLPRVVAVVGIHGEMNSGAELAADLGKLVLRKAEEHGDGLKLRDDDETIGIVGVHDISRVNEAQADAAIDGSGDPAISELKFGIVNLALIGFDGAVKLTDKRGLRIELLLRDHAFVKKKPVTLQVGFRVLALGLILGKLAFGLFELDLKRPRINLYEKIALV